MPAKPQDPNLHPMSDDNVLIPMGVYPGITQINKFGQNANIAQGVQEEIWDGSLAYTWPTTATITKINTTADIEAMRGETVEIQGLNADWELVIQNAVLDGTNSTTLVTIPTPLIRVFRMKFQSTVVGSSSITLVNDADNVLYGNIEPGNNQTLMAMYTVPLGKTAYVTQYYSLVNAGVGNPTALPVKMWARDNVNGYAPQLKHVMSIDLDFTAQVDHVFRPYLKFTEKTDIFLTGQPVGAAANVTAGFDIILVDD